MLDDEEMSSGLHYPKSIMQTARIVRCSVTKAREPCYFQIVDSVLHVLWNSALHVVFQEKLLCRMGG